MNKPKLPLFFISILIVTLALSSFSCILLLAETNNEDLEVDFTHLNDLQNMFNLTAVQNHIRFMVDVSPRITGYNGCDLAANYIHQFFEDLGFNVTEQLFDVVVPVSYGANITIENFPELKLHIYALEPNEIIPVTTANLSGKIIYADEGELEDFNGKEVQGSIVLMKFNSGSNWLNALRLGAKAVIFIEPTETFRSEINSKSVDLPINFPRFYMPAEDAYKLLQLMKKSKEPLKAIISSSMIWEKRKGRNIIATLPGSEFDDKIVVFSAHYDSYSVVPELSPGANDAIGIATLLELARIFKMLRPPYTIMFVAFSGHHQGLKGSRYFAGEYFLGGKANIGAKVVLMMHIQVSSLSDHLAFSNTDSWVYDSALGQHPMDMWQKVDEYLTKLTDKINSVLNNNIHIDSAMVKTRGGFDARERTRVIPYMDPNDASPLSYIQAPAFSIVTVDYAEYRDSPIDRYDKIDLENLRANVENILYISYGLAFTRNLDAHMPGAPIMDWYAEISGRVVTYNETLGDYQPIPNALVVSTRVYGGFKSQYKLVEFSDENGFFKFENLPTRQRSVGFNPFPIEAYILNVTTGNPIYYPDFGTYSWSYYAYPSEDVDVGYVVVFKGGSIVLLGLIYPRTLDDLLGTAEDVKNVLNIAPGSIEVLKAKDYSNLKSYGFKAIGSIATVFIPPNTPSIIVLRTLRLGRTPAGILLNSSLERPEGRGYTVKLGEQHILNAPIEIVNSYIYNLKSSIEKLSKLKLKLNIEEYEKFEEQCVLAAEAYKEKKYDVMNVHLLSAWAYALTVYEITNGLYVDTVSTLPFFAFLLIPFTLIFNYVVLGIKGRKAILSCLSIMAIMILIFTFLHPSFSLASNPIMLVFSIAVIMLATPAVALLFSNLIATIKRISEMVLGKHRIEVSRGSMMLLYFQVAFENLRKRKLRSSLLIISLMLITLDLVLFSSFETLNIMEVQELEYPAPYQGVYIRSPTWEGISLNIYEIVKAKYPDTPIIPRFWYYSPSPSEDPIINPEIKIKLWKGDKYVPIYAFMGLAAEEVNGSFLPKTLKDGRWFIPTDEYVCILPSSTAEALNISVGDDVKIFERKFKVIGILNSGFFFSIKELDGEEVTPWDQTIEDQFSVHVDPEIYHIVLLPYETLRRIRGGTYLASISIIVKDPSYADKIVKELFDSFRELYIFSSAGEKTKIYYYRNIYTVTGWQTQIVPMIISFLLILNIMIGGVYERKKDVFIFSSLGLSPLQVSLLFLAESIVYAVLGSVLGYLIAMGLIYFSDILPMPIPFLNYSSIWVVITVSSAMLVTMASTIYPSFITSRLVTPSLERVWQPPTKPSGNVWEIPFPFIFKEENELRAFCNYLLEFFKAHAGEVEIFSCSNLKYKEDPEAAVKMISMKCKLEPYELGVIQHVELPFNLNRERNVWGASIILERLSGDWNEWKRLNFKFVDAVRKQFLLWRSLSDEDKKRYWR